MSHRTSARPNAVHPKGAKNADRLLAVASTVATDGDAGSRIANLQQIALLDRHFEEFVAYAGGFLNHSSVSLGWYRRSFASFRAFLLSNILMPEAGFGARLFDIEGWVIHLYSSASVGRKLSPITVNTYWRGLRRFFIDMERRGGLNPFRGLKPPKFEAPVPKAKSGDDCRRILEAAYHYPWPEPHVRYKRVLGQAVIGVMLLAGLRRSEVVGLRNGDVDPSTGTIHIAHGKGVAGGRPRKAYISPDLRAILVAYNREREGIKHLFERTEYFVSPKSGRGLSLEGLRKIVAKVSRASGVPFSAHVLRHSFVTHLLRSDVPLHIVRDLAGHKSIATTLGYLRVFDEDLFVNIRKMRFT